MFEQVEVNSERWFDLTPLLNEEFRPIKNYNGLYQISNYGRVKSKVYHKNKILKCIEDKDGYLYVNNPNNYLYINHKDENKKNNNINNLEWCTIKYNNNYGTCQKRKGNSRKRKINQYDLNGNFIKTWDSATDISKKYNITKQSIVSCCRNKSKMCMNYKWQYFDNK